MSNDIANRGEILLYDITISILETVRQDTMYISEFEPPDRAIPQGGITMSRQFELNKALFEAVTACFDYHIDLSTCTNVPHGLQNATLTIRDPQSKKIVWTLSI